MGVFMFINIKFVNFIVAILLLYLMNQIYTVYQKFTLD